jgi:hypothetical protein
MILNNDCNVKENFEMFSNLKYIYDRLNGNIYLTTFTHIHISYNYRNSKHVFKCKLIGFFIIVKECFP